MSITFGYEARSNVATGRDERVHLVGAPKLEVEKILADARVEPNDREQVAWQGQLRQIAESYRAETFTELEQVVHLPVELITGGDIVSAIQRAQDEMRGSNSGISLTRLPVINLAPLTIKIAEQVGAVRDQVIQVSQDGGTVFWNAPEFQVGISRAVFHKLKKNFEDNRAGFVGEGRPLYQQFRDIGQMLGDRGHKQVLVVDDRCSASGETMKYVRDRLRRDEVSVAAFVVGHAAMAAEGKDGGYPRIDGVRVIAPFFRFATPRDEGLKPGIADELKDIGYSSAAGNCYMAGYDDHVRDALQRVEPILNTMIADNRSDIEAITRDGAAKLAQVGVIVRDQNQLEQFIAEKKCANNGMPGLISNKDLRDLFAEHPGHLRLTARPNWDPKLASPARLPTLWPGDPQENSFNRLLERFNANNPKEGWLRVSYAQLTATIHMLEGLHDMLGHKIPRSAFPFLEMSQVQELLPYDLRHHSVPAIDVLSELCKQVGSILGNPR